MSARGIEPDVVEIEVFRHRVAAIAEEMGAVLARSGFSANIKERRDFSCAVFDSDGQLVAQAAHIPVHLGSMQLAVESVLARCTLVEGDVVGVNDPFSGGTHLPDLTLVAPVCLAQRTRPFGYVAARAHHADVGGAFPGSMGLAEEIYQEGIRLPPVYIVRRGRVCADVIEIFTGNTRVPEERKGDLLAQLAALRVGKKRLRELAFTAGRARLRAAMAALQDYSERRLRGVLRSLPKGVFRARDYLDDDGMGATRLPLCVAIAVEASTMTFDFSGSASQTRGGVNANLAVTWAAVLYCLQLLARGEIPANAGLMRPVRLVAPEGTIVNARFPAAVAGGNVETSQRIVDVVLRALAQAAPDRVPAASCGSMNNVAIGGTGAAPAATFAYYETIGGGAGGGPNGPGASGLHTHMTNTWNTPVEALEAQYPLRVTEYSIRRGSGGSGFHRGGDGIVREIELLSRARVSLLTERRTYAPWGLWGGGPGHPGRNWLVRSNKAKPQDRGKQPLPAKVTIAVGPGDRVRLETPGGGGWGKIQGARGR
ncbi:MAG: N-methylhydantoinase B [Candidatus Binatia bacterium]|nr:MAG: N-methylhydantoinase B [Candidatus Binatia bacterium]